MSPGPVALNGPVIGERRQVGNAQRVSRVMGAADGPRRPHRVDRVTLLDPRGRDLMRPGCERHANFGPLLDLVGDQRVVVEIRRPVFLATHIGEMHTHAVHGVLQHVLVLETTKHAQVRAEEFGRQLYSPATWIVGVASNAADGPERQPFHLPILRRVLRNGVDVRGGADVGIAHRERADLARRADVLLHQRRVHAKDVSDVVESVRRVVRRQQRGWIHFEVEQIADGVGVLGAVQPMECRTARIRVGRVPPRRARPSMPSPAARRVAASG